MGYRAILCPDAQHAAAQAKARSAKNMVLAFAQWVSVPYCKGACRPANPPMVQMYEPTVTDTDPKTVNVIFPVTGPQLPVDHGWVIYAAISKVVPFVHGNPTVSIRGIEGCTGMGDWLRLNSDARLELRLPESDVPQLLALEGERLNIRTAVLTLGNAQVRPLEASTEVHARIVVVAGSTEWEDARVVIQRRLETLGVAAQVTGGKRRVLSVKRFKNVGFGVGLSGLSLDGSIQVMTRGIGGRRSMGAGYFVPGPLPYGSQSSLTGQYPSLTRLPPR